MLINAGMVLLTDQVTKLIARKDDGFAVRRLTHLHRGLTPLGVGITADFGGQRAIKLLNKRKGELPPLKAAADAADHVYYTLRLGSIFIQKS